MKEHGAWQYWRARVFAEKSLAGHCLDEQEYERIIGLHISRHARTTMFHDSPLRAPFRKCDAIIRCASRWLSRKEKKVWRVEDWNTACQTIADRGHFHNTSLKVALIGGNQRRRITLVRDEAPDICFPFSELRLRKWGEIQERRKQEQQNALFLIKGTCFLCKTRPSKNHWLKKNCGVVNELLDDMEKHGFVRDRKYSLSVCDVCYRFLSKQARKYSESLELAGDIRRTIRAMQKQRKESNAATENNAGTA